jgi:anti-sigma regulatory factor (Ser/Thr protein kinase)
MHELPIQSGDDVVRVRQQVRGLAAESGLSLVDQTKVITAASELARNALVYGGGGMARAEVVTSGTGRKGVKIDFTDDGPGISDIDLGLRSGPGPVRCPSARGRIRADLQAGWRHQRHGDQVVSLSWPLKAPLPQDMRWLQVEDISAVGACRNAALAMAGRLRFPSARADKLALAVTEAASNLHKHARAGSLLLCVNRDADAPGIQLVTIDAGPGVRDVGAAMRDGHSTAGTLGIGLGAIRRLADFSDMYSMPGHGTALVARFWPEPGPAAVRYAGLIRPMTGETECGDAFGVVEADDTVTAVLCDGLGHGPLAAAASAQALAAVLDEPPAEPAALLERAHRRMSGTRGGAVGIVQLSGQTARFAGLGNVAASILSAGSRKSMLSVPGIAGYQARTFRQFDYQVPPGAAIILHSDGLSSRWQVDALPGVDTRDPLLIAAVLLAEAGIHRDDAGVLVLKS